jgi:hypothetical protein
MTADFHSAHAYLAFDRLIGKIERAMPGLLPTACGCSPEGVAERLAQRLVECLHRLYIKLMNMRTHGGAGATAREYEIRLATI